MVLALRSQSQCGFWVELNRNRNGIYHFMHGRYGSALAKADFQCALLDGPFLEVT